MAADSCLIRLGAWIMGSAYGRKRAHRSPLRLPAYLRRFWYDTITHASIPLKFLIELVGPDRVVLGTDLPFDMADDRFDHYFSALDSRDQDAVTSDNAAALFGIAPAQQAHK